jgi:hypothetical protein
MNVSRLLLLGSVWFAATMSIVSAERAPLSPEKLDGESTHRVEGRVLGVYSRDVSSNLYGPGTIVTEMVVEIEVTSIVKGDRLENRDVIYARCWDLKQRGAAGLTPGPSGHFAVPKAGDVVEAYLARGTYGPTGQTDQGFAVVYPNGIKIVTPATEAPK